MALCSSGGRSQDAESCEQQQSEIVVPQALPSQYQTADELALRAEVSRTSAATHFFDQDRFTGRLYHGVSPA